MKKIFFSALFFVGFFLVGGVVFASGASAATVDVDTTDDEYDTTPNATCSLREAFESVETGADFGGCIADGVYGATGGDHIELQSMETYVLTLNDPSYVGGNEDGGLLCQNSVTVNGNQSTINATVLNSEIGEVAMLLMGNGSRVANLHVIGGEQAAVEVNGDNVVMEALEVSGTNRYGILAAGGSVELYNSNVISTGMTDGIIVMNDSEMYMTDIFFSGDGTQLAARDNCFVDIVNSSFVGTGWGVYASDNSQVNVIMSLFDGNQTAINMSGDAWVFVLNSTISVDMNDFDQAITIANAESEEGSYLALFFVTIDGNGEEALVIEDRNAYVELYASIINNSTCSGVTSTIHSSGYNLDSLLTAENVCNLTDPTDRHNDPSINLGTLGYYGGLTNTIPLLEGSSAIDIVPADECAEFYSDQRGFERPFGLGCDAGAYEVQQAFEEEEEPDGNGDIDTGEEAGDVLGLATTGMDITMYSLSGTALLGTALIIAKKKFSRKR